MHPVTYSLQDENGCSDKFYEELQSFTTRFFKQAMQEHEEKIKRYVYFIFSNQLESPRSQREYLIEYLTIGVLWNTYHQNAGKLSQVKKETLRYLFNLRSNNERLKPAVDKLRGFLMAQWLVKPNRRVRLPYAATGFNKLVDWLDAVGDFREEVKRFRLWQQFFMQITALDASSYLAAAARLALFFEKEAADKFSPYTTHVDDFLRDEHPKHKYNENYFFTGRKKVEYYLNMVAAEVLNREFRKEFDLKPQKIVLLPTCMRSKSDAECRAMRNGLDIHCTGCDKNCRIHQLTLKCKKIGVETRLVPHSSQFTMWLKQYQDNDQVALVGVACVLNLLTGGYEMKNLGLASQCVFLDYCGCKKHWHPQGGLSTDLNERQLQRILPQQNILHKVTNYLYAIK